MSNGSKATIPLGQIAEIDMGTSPPGTSYNKEGIGVPLINGPTEFTDNSPVPQQWTTEPTRVCRKGDILICVRGASTGRMNTADREYCIGRGVAAIRDREDPLATPLLRYVIEHQLPSLLRFATGSTFVAVDKKAISNIPVPAFDARQRRETARLLNRSEEVELLLSRIITAKREFKRGLMQELLTGRRRFPEFGPSHNGTEGPPAGWKEVKLGDLGRVVSGGTPSTKVPEYWDGGIAWCTPSDITALKSPFIDGTERELSEKGVENSSAEVLPPYSVIVCTRATIGAAAINRIPMATNQGFKSIIPEEGYCAEFIYYLVLHNRNQLLRRAAGSTFLEVSADSFSSLPVFVPESTAEQRRIADVLLRLDEEIQLLEQLLDQFDINKRGLMQKLLTGELTVPVSSEPEPVHA